MQKEEDGLVGSTRDLSGQLVPGSNTDQATGQVVELRSSMKLISYACYLIAFMLAIILSSIYFGIRINYALALFEDIYTNWENHYIVDIIEKPANLASCADIPQLPGALPYTEVIDFQFKGSKQGCFCEDCDEDESDDDDQKISDLLRHSILEQADEYNDEKESMEEERRRLLHVKPPTTLSSKKSSIQHKNYNNNNNNFNTNDNFSGKISAHNPLRRNQKQNQSNKVSKQSTEAITIKRRRPRKRILETDYEDQSSEEFNSILDWTVAAKSCDNVHDLDRDDVYIEIDPLLSQNITSLLIGSENLSAGNNPESIHLCYARSNSSNFITSYITDPQLECPIGKKPCKAGSDKSLWFCVLSEEQCPIRGMKVVRTEDIEQTPDLKVYENVIPLGSSGAYSLLISRTRESMPISEFGVFEDEGPCILSKTRWRLSSENKILNPLINITQSYLCQSDSRFEKTGMFSSQKALFKEHGILERMINAGYPNFFLPQSRVTLHLFARPYIPFHIECRDQLDEVLGLSRLINKLNYFSVTIVSSSAGLSSLLLIDVVYIVMQVYKGWHSKVQCYPWRNPPKIAHAVYSGFKYIAALNTCMFDFILFYRMINLRELGQDIIYQNCTDDLSERQLSEMRNRLSFYGMFFHIIVCLCFWTSDLHLINFARKYCIMNRKKMAPFDEFFSLSKFATNNQINNNNNNDSNSNSNTNRNNNNLPNINIANQPESSNLPADVIKLDSSSFTDRSSRNIRNNNNNTNNNVNESVNKSQQSQKNKQPSQVMVDVQVEIAQPGTRKHALIEAQRQKDGGDPSGGFINFPVAQQNPQQRVEINRIQEFNMELQYLQKQSDESAEPRTQANLLPESNNPPPHSLNLFTLKDRK